MVEGVNRFFDDDVPPHDDARGAHDASVTARWGNMADGAGATEPIHIMGAGLSGLAAATILAKAGKDVHVHEVRADSGARFDGDFQALENWSMDADFFQQLEQFWT